MTIEVTLKYFQQETVNAVRKEFKAGISSQLIHLPTGSGKTYIMAAIAKSFNQKTLIIAHRKELIYQAVDKIKHVWPDADIGICMGDIHDIDHQVVVGSIQTCSQSKRLQQLKKPGFGVLLIDEAHHASSSTYKKLIKKLNFNSKRKLLVGVTATPERNDKLGLLDVFQKITYSISIATMIKNDHLSPVMGRKILTNTSLIGVKTHNGDFVSSSLSKAVNTPERNNFITNKFIKHAWDRKAVAFCADIKHCKNLAAAFVEQGIKAVAVWGNMPPEDRQKALTDFKNGELQLLTSCGILTEGYDEESISCIIMARPTKSRSLYIQCVGRGLRKPNNPLSKKIDCLVLDFTDNHHTISTTMTLKATIPAAVELRR